MAIAERNSGDSHQRIDLNELIPDAYKAVLGLETYVKRSGLDHGLVELVKIRASQINGCAYCLDMHHTDARGRGESQRRLDVLSAWREVPTLFTDQERAALTFTEVVTRMPEGGVPDEVWDEAVRQLGEVATAQLLVAVATINVWNRLAVATRQQPPALD